MRVLLQRVSHARVTVAGEVVGEIGAGLLAFIGVAPGDTQETAARLAVKAVELRIFEDADGRMNLSLIDTDGAMLCISQFTLYGDTRRGRRPSFVGAAVPAVGEAMYGAFCDAVAGQGVRVERGVFGAHMLVELANDGPVTLMLDSEELERPRRA